MKMNLLVFLMLISQTAFAEDGFLTRGGHYPDDAKTVKDKICNGSSPRLVWEESANYKPRVVSGISMDNATGQMGVDYYMADHFFKHDFVMSKSGNTYRDRLLSITVPRDMYEDNSDPFMFIRKYDKLQDKYNDGESTLSKIVENYAFHWDDSVAIDLFQNPENDMKLSSFGYSFSPRGALSMAVHYWRLVFIWDTKLKKAPQDDGSVDYTVTWTPSIFCKYAILKEDLLSN
jgi:hypothetical protein